MQGYLNLPEFSKIDLISASDKKIATLEKVTNPDWDNFLFELDQIVDEIQRFYSPVRHMNAVVNSDELREVHNACLPKLTAWYTELGQNRALYKHTRAIADSDAFKSYDQGQRKSIEDQLLSFTLGGVALEGKDRERYKEIAAELSKLSTKFNENVLDSGNDFRLNFADEKALDGFPENSLDLAKQNAEQKGEQGYSLSLDFPNYYAVMTFANDRDLRKQMYLAWNSRATGISDEKWNNAPVIEQTVKLRTEKASLLGFDSYADYSIANKMVDSPQQVIDFLNDLGKRAKPAALKDYEELAAFATDEAEIKVDTLEPWDVSYYSNQLKKKLYDFSEQDLKPYFPASICVPGMFEVTGKLFGIDISEVADADVWHEDVSLYQITDKTTGELRGAFYMDNYARDGKRAGAWMDVCVGRMKKNDGVQLPVAYLTCNLTPPVGDQPALLTHNELTTLFHEFGHGLHHMLTRETGAGRENQLILSVVIMKLLTNCRRNYSTKPALQKTFSQGLRRYGSLSLDCSICTRTCEQMHRMLLRFSNCWTKFVQMLPFIVCLKRLSSKMRFLTFLPEVMRPATLVTSGLKCYLLTRMPNSKRMGYLTRKPVGTLCALFLKKVVLKKRLNSS